MATEPEPHMSRSEVMLSYAAIGVLVAVLLLVFYGVATVGH